MNKKLVSRVLVVSAVIVAGLVMQGCGLLMARNEVKELTAEEIADLKTEVTDAQSLKSLSFMASFKQREASGHERGNYAKSGKIPFSLVGYLMEVSAKDGKQIMNRQQGTASFVMKDSKGAVVQRGVVSLDALFPTKDKKGGYHGEVAGPGEYTVVIWTKHGANVFGREMTAKLDAVK